MMVVGLTGGIGAGKTTVAKTFETLGVPVFYADEIAKKQYQNPIVLQKLQADLGMNMLLADGSLNKKALAKKIFSDPNARKIVENTIHPLVKKAFDAWKKEPNQAAAPYIIREAAILLESGASSDCHWILVVTAPLNQRLERIAKRDGISKEAVQNRVNTQWSDEERLAKASHHLDNPDGMDLTHKITELHHIFLNLAKSHENPV